MNKILYSIAILGFNLLGSIMVVSLFLQIQSSYAEENVDSSIVKKGEYLFHASGCEMCHTAPNGQFLAGGKAFYLPKQGVIYSSNITSDDRTGIRRYTDDEFVSALQRGIGHKGKRLYPVMPYSFYRLMSRQDILAIRAYLNTQSSIEHKVPENDMAFPYNMRWIIRFWGWANYTGVKFKEDSSQSKLWNRGKYLVEGPAHCAYCHTPLNWSKGRSVIQDYSGGKSEGWTAYNITSSTDTGIGSWNDADIEQYLSKGFADGHGAASGPMAEVVNQSLSYLTEQDIQAIAVYLRSLMPMEKHQGAVTLSVEAFEKAEPSHSHGSQLYITACASCHFEHGKEEEQKPAENLLGSRTATVSTGNNLVKLILDGSELHSSAGDFKMPAFKGEYQDQDIADIANYVIFHFGHRNGRVTAEQVKQERLNSLK